MLARGHNDVGHVIQAGALWLLHVAGLEMRDVLRGASRVPSTGL